MRSKIDLGFLQLTEDEKEEILLHIYFYGCGPIASLITTLRKKGLKPYAIAEYLEVIPNTVYESSRMVKRKMDKMDKR
jgi:hypothetical protein